MKSSIFIVFTLAVLTTFAQKEVPSKDQIQQFKKTTTYVVLDDNPLLGFNFKIREAVKNVWTITPVDFISSEDYDKLRKSTKNSFITIDEVWFTKDNTQAHYNFLCLSLGGNYKSQSDMPQLCTVPLSYAEVDESNYIYKLSSLLQIIQDHVLFVENEPHISDINIIKKYNDNAYLIKDKTLYVIKDEMERSINTEAKFKKVYPYKFKFVTRDELEKAIDSKQAGVVYLHKVGPEGTQRKARCYKTIIGTEKSKLYYFDYHMIDDKSPDGLLEKDLKKIVKAKAA
ncbi:MAG: hypothetical protein JXR60_05230 [Bacteroidales bacterium]|nr:hypothetical protein [Bacteroidales bacterium]